MNNENVVLEMRHITKAYPNVVANDDVSIHLQKGEILAIVGENGAGKTTLMQILYGLKRADVGEIYYKGELVGVRDPSDAMRLGIGMVQQHFMLFGNMSVAENIVYQNEPRKGFLYDKKKANAIVKQLSQKYDLDVDPEKLVEDYPVGLQQRIEILKVLYQNAEVIIFDEPTAVLTPLEVVHLLDSMRQLREMGKSIILITHKLTEVMEVSDRVIVMRDGKVVNESETAKTDLGTLSYHVVNRHIKHESIQIKNPGQPLLQVTNLTLIGESGKKILDDVNIHVRSGEIVGVAGVSGNGQSELVSCITGLSKFDSGEIIINSHEAINGSVSENREMGLSHIPEDRYLMGCAEEASLADNALMGFEEQQPFSYYGFLNKPKIRNHARLLIDQYDVRADSELQKLSALSGGNTQKLIVAREISKKTPILIANEPTRGIDIGAMEFIHDKLLDKRDQGDCVLLISSELTEILKLSDRIYVIFDGNINGEFDRGKIDEKSLGIIMLGGRVEINAKG